MVIVINAFIFDPLKIFKSWYLCPGSISYASIKEKLRQLRDNIIGKRPEDENAYGEYKLSAPQNEKGVE